MYNISDSFSTVLKNQWTWRWTPVEMPHPFVQEINCFFHTFLILPFWSGLPFMHVAYRKQWWDRSHIVVKKSCICDKLKHILPLLVGHFFALVALVTPASLLFVTELMVQLRSEFVGILGKLLPISYASECGETLKSEESVDCLDLLCHVW